MGTPVPSVFAGNTRKLTGFKNGGRVIPNIRIPGPTIKHQRGPAAAAADNGSKDLSPLSPAERSSRRESFSMKFSTAKREGDSHRLAALIRDNHETNRDYLESVLTSSHSDISKKKESSRLSASGVIPSRIQIVNQNSNPC